MNFNGRVKQSSAKNFQLIQNDHGINISSLIKIFTKDTIYLQFGKIDENTFSMDFQHPFSIFQAFAVSISSLATKIFCE